ncbi:unnamed protein product [Dicrocoelium dendriticum]|nr:unnamed protein product [Dicrocoelium dendriticum]
MKSGLVAEWGGGGVGGGLRGAWSGWGGGVCGVGDKWCIVSHWADGGGWGGGGGGAYCDTDQLLWMYIVEHWDAGSGSGGDQAGGQE